MFSTSFLFSWNKIYIMTAKSSEANNLTSNQTFKLNPVLRQKITEGMFNIDKQSKDSICVF